MNNNNVLQFTWALKLKETRSLGVSTKFAVLSKKAFIFRSAVDLFIQKLVHKEH